jgi:hypothetical protein
VWISYPRSTCGVLTLGGPLAEAAKEKLVRVNRPKINKRERITSRVFPGLFDFRGEPLVSEKVD